MRYINSMKKMSNMYFPLLLQNSCCAISNKPSCSAVQLSFVLDRQCLFSSFSCLFWTWFKEETSEERKWWIWTILFISSLFMPGFEEETLPVRLLRTEKKCFFSSFFMSFLDLVQRRDKWGKDKYEQFFHFQSFTVWIWSWKKSLK